jgi:hypothetical protein
MLKKKLAAAVIGASVLCAAGGAALAQSLGNDNTWLQGVMKGMEMMGGKMKNSTMTDMPGMAMSKPGMVIIDLKTGRMIAIDGAEAAKYFPANP